MERRSTWSITVMCALRAVIGVGATGMPNSTLKQYGIESGSASLLTYLTRLFGAREIALATGTFASRGAAKSLWLQLGIGCDVIDAGAALLAARDGALSGRGKYQATVGPVLAIAIALHALITGSYQTGQRP
jgi:hypothetical protein